MAKWEKLEILTIWTKEENINIENIENEFDFPLLQKLSLRLKRCTLCFYESCKNFRINIEQNR